MTDRIELIYRGQVPNLLCCDTILRKMPNSEWVTVMLSGGHMEPLPENNVFICRSKDEGTTWSKPEMIFKGTGKALVPCELMIINDRCILFVAVHNGKFLEWENCYSVSIDSGYSWSELKPFQHKFNNTAMRNAFVKKNGEIVLPYQHYEIYEEEYKRLKSEGIAFYHSKTAKSENGVLISSDNGETWECHGGIHVDTEHWIWAENNAVELGDGSLAMLIRVDGTGVLYRADSNDGGRTWGQPYATDIPNPGSKFRLFGLTDGRIVLINNPAPAKGNCMDGRNPLSIWISKDDMKSWDVKRDLVKFPGWLSYPDGFADEEKGYINFAFDYNRHDAIYVGAKI